MFWKPPIESSPGKAGAILFLLSTLLGFLMRAFTLPRVGLSAHMVGLMQGLLLLTSGQVWPRLSLRPTVSRSVCVLLIAGCYSAWAGNVLAGAWGAGGTLLPQAAGSARGTPLQEWVLVVLVRGGGLSLIAAWLVISWGLIINSKYANKGVHNDSRQN